MEKSFEKRAKKVKKIKNSAENYKNSRKNHNEKFDENSTKIAIVHDWILDKGGAELVVAELHKIFPRAPIFTSYCDPKVRANFGDVRTGFLQHFGKIRKFIPFLRIFYFSHLNLQNFDVIISSSGAEAKGVKTAPNQLHINYCHAPTHYYWSRYDEYMRDPGFSKLNFLARFGLKILVSPLRKWDFRAAQKPNFLIANSTHIKNEIKKYYKRDATVIFPPIELSQFAAKKNIPREDFYLIVGRLTPYKRNDLAVSACAKLGKKLAVVGDGPDRENLEKIAQNSPQIKFLGRVSDAKKIDLWARAKGLIFAGLDDFGITMVESLASGCPVIAFDAGGAKDIISTGDGILFEKQTAENLEKALLKFEKSKFDSAKVRESAKRFSAKKFDEKMLKFVREKWEKFEKSL